MRFGRVVVIIRGFGYEKGRAMGRQKGYGRGFKYPCPSLLQCSA